MYKTFSAVGKNKLAADLERLLQDIQDAPKGLTAEDIYDKYYAVGDSREIAGMIHMLISMGQVARVKGEATNGNKEQARYIALYTRSHVAQKRAENFGADT